MRWPAFLFFFFFLAFPVLAGEKLVIGAEEQLGFAESLYQAGEYYRAIGEFERFAHFFPDSPQCPRALLFIGRSYYQGQRFHDAEKAFKRLLARFPRGPESKKARYFICLCRDKLEGTGSSASCFAALARDYPDLAAGAWNGLGWAYIEDGDWKAAQAAFSNISPDQQQGFHVPFLEKRLSDAKNLPLKKPGLAGCLSVIPGAGHLYTGRYQDALIAFLLNGALIYATYEAFEEDSPALGSVAGVVAAGFYAGNIYSAVSSAHKHNLKQEQEFIRLLKTETRPTLAPLAGPDGGMGLGVRIPF